MAKFLGHVLPGIYVLVVALWWSYNVFRDFFRSSGHTAPATGVGDEMTKEDENRHPPFRSRIWYPDAICHRFPLEIAAKIVLSAGDILVELSSGVIQIHDLHHSVIMMSTIADGMVDLMVHYKWPIPEHSDTASYIVKVLIDIVVFTSHQNGKTTFDQAWHTYILWLFAALALLGALQTLYLSSAILPLARALIFQLYGTWLIQVGFIVESPFCLDVFHWNDKTEADQLMIIGFIFTCHCMLNMVALFLFGMCVFYLTKTVPKPTNVLLTDSNTFADDDTETLVSLQTEFYSKPDGLILG